MQIFVDADACPEKEEILRQAKRRGIPVTMILDTSHQYEDGYSRVITVSKGADSADFRLINLLSPGDIAVTQDYALAAMALARGARVLHQDGMEYTAENIDALLLARHTARKLRSAGKGKTRLPHLKKRTEEQSRQFARALERLLTQLLDVPERDVPNTAPGQEDNR